MTARAVAREDLELRAVVQAVTPLFFTAGADEKLDRPAHVRAGSALVRCPTGALAIVQDDTSFLAFLDPKSGKIADVALPSEDGVRQFDDLRGNKKQKLDLEAAIVDAKGRVIAFGSGSSSLRERVVIASESLAPRIVHAGALYEKLRSDRTFSGSELNIEGATITGDHVLFFQRGNGAPDDAHAPVDATARVELLPLLRYLDGEGPCPSIEDVVQWDLGTIDGVRLTFTDAATMLDGRVAFLACAEASPDATRDGPVSGAVLGILDDRARTARFARILDLEKKPLVDKTEGLVFDATDPLVAYVVFDADDPERPSGLMKLALSGPSWRP